MAREQARAHGPTRRLDSALELIFLQAGCVARRAELLPQTRDALSRVHFGRLVTELTVRRLLPLIGTRLVDAAGDLCPEEFRVAVRAGRTKARFRGLAVEGATRRVTLMLEAHGIPALPLKGPLLAEAAHGDIGLRETQDLDLLVPRPRLWDAAALLSAQGFRGPTDALRPDGLPELHLVLHHPSEPPVELHWRVHWYEADFSQEMLARATLGPDGVRRAQPEDLAVSILLFYARDGFHGVRLASDLAAWWDRCGDALRPRSLEAYLRRHLSLSRTLTAAAAAAEEVTGVPALEQLGAATAGGRRTTLAVHLADWKQAADRDQAAANVSLVSALLCPPGSAGGFVRRELSSDSGRTRHATKTLARYAWALLQLRRGRRWAEAPVLRE